VADAGAFAAALRALELAAGVPVLGLLTPDAPVLLCRNAACSRAFTNARGCRPSKYCCPRCEDTANKRAARRRRRYREVAASVASAGL
jgi:hypothetical protein